MATIRVSEEVVDAIRSRKVHPNVSDNEIVEFALKNTKNFFINNQLINKKENKEKVSSKTLK